MRNAQTLRLVLFSALLMTLPACTFIQPPRATLPSRDGLIPGEVVTVKGSETIYAIAHDHNVSMREIIVLNKLKPPYAVRPGQSLTLPANGTSFAGDIKPPQPAPLDPVEKSSLSPLQPPPVSAQPLEPLTFGSGASSSVAAQTSLPSANPAVSPATSLPPFPSTLPVAPTNASPNIPAVPPAIKTPAAQTALQSLGPVATSQPTPLAPLEETSKLSVLTTIASGAKPAPSAGTSESDASDGDVVMKWPVQGPILSGFGSKGGGTNNDGVNIGAPKGSPVVAAAGGTVVYAGNEMKGFGNLVLIRHQGDWVTAYAHLDRVLVKKESIVAPGDMIGTVGKTGNVSSPQLHFETRQNGKAVDPANVIKSDP